MKTTLFKNGAIAALAALAVLISACKKDESKTDIENSAIVGKWVSRSNPAEFFLLSGDGTGLRCDQDRPATHPLAVMNWTVPDDGKLLMAFGEGKLHGLLIPAMSVPYHYELKGDVLTAWLEEFEESKTTYDRSGSEGE